MDLLMSGLVGAMTLLALIPLFSVVWMLVWHGGQKLTSPSSPSCLRRRWKRAAGSGTPFWAPSLWSPWRPHQRSLRHPERCIPRRDRFEKPPRERRQVRRKGVHRLPLYPCRCFCLRRSGSPHGGYSAIAGAVALFILMLPTIILTAEDAIRMVPAKMREAAIGMGATTTQTVWMVLLHGPARHFYRHHARHRQGGRGDGAPPPHRPFQQLLDRRGRRDRPDATHGVVGCPYLQFRWYALREPGQTGLGSGAGTRPAGFRDESHRAGISTPSNP